MRFMSWTPFEFLSAAARRRIQQVEIEPDRVRQALDRNMQMKAFHAITLFRCDTPAVLRTAAPGDRRGAPWQQFSVR
jgi:hypothetical protein